VLAVAATTLGCAVYRRWEPHWGATDEEVAAVMPGDDVVSRPWFSATRSLTIAASHWVALRQCRATPGGPALELG